MQRDLQYIALTVQSINVLETAALLLLSINICVNQWGTTRVKSELFIVYYVTGPTLTVWQTTSAVCKLPNCLSVLLAVVNTNEVMKLLFMLSTSLIDNFRSKTT